MKVTLVNSLYHPHALGGAEHGLRLLAEGLVARGIDAAVVCLSPSGREERGDVGGVRVTRLPLGNLYWPFGADRAPGTARRVLWHMADAYNPLMARRLAAALDADRPDLVHFHNVAGFSVAAVRAAKRLRLPIVQTLHDYYPVCVRSTTFRGGANCAAQCAQCRVFTAPRRRLGGLPDLVCGVSWAVLARLEAFGAARGAARRGVVYNANPPVGPAPPRRDRGPGEVLRVGYIGRLDPTKGVEVLIEAARALGPLPFEVAVAGTGPPDYEARLRLAAEGLPVRFVGHAAPADFFAGVDVLVVPSIWHEPFGRVVQEAFALGVPVVASRIGGIPEAVGPDGPGWLVPPGDAAALAGVLRGLIERGLPAQALREACLARSRAFALDAVLEEQIALYEQILSASGTGRGG